MKTYWEVLAWVVLWIALVAGAIVFVVWLSILWAFTPVVLFGIGFIMILAFVIWVEQ